MPEQLKAYFNTSWPSDSWTSLSHGDLDSCLAAIPIADCNSLADFLNVTVNKCTMANACAGPGG